MPEESVITEPATEPTTQPQEEVNEPKVEQTVTPSWKDALSEDLKSDKTFDKFKDFSGLAKSYKELESKIGQKGIIPPKEGDEKDVERFYKELGRPEEPTKYQAPELEIEDQYKQFFSEEKINEFKDIAFKNGLTQKQFEAITKQYTETQLNDIRGIVTEQTKAAEDAKLALMKEWSVDYDAKAKEASRALDSLSEDIPKDKLDQYKSDPYLQRIFAKVADTISEDNLRKGTPGSNGTVSELRSFIDSQIKNNNSSYYDQMAPDHQETVRKVTDAYKQLDAMNNGGV